MKLLALLAEGGGGGVEDGGELPRGGGGGELPFPASTGMAVSSLCCSCCFWLIILLLHRDVDAFFFKLIFGLKYVPLLTTFLCSIFS